MDTAKESARKKTVSGADDWDRTNSLCSTDALFYQLNYVSILKYFLIVTRRTLVTSVMSSSLSFSHNPVRFSAVTFGAQNLQICWYTLTAF